jgi:cyclomaltodextrinase
MAEIVDFFFSPHLTPHQRRMQAALEDGLAHGSQIEPRDPTPDDPVTLFFLTDAHLPIERVAVYYTIDGSVPIGAKGIATNGTAVQAERGEFLYDEQRRPVARQWRVVLPAQHDGTLVRYRADGWSVSDPHMHRYADNADPVSMPPAQGRIFAYHVDRWMVPTWWRDAVVYQIYVDRFNAAHNEPPLLNHAESDITGYFGGTLHGVLEKLDYLQELGINCIWLSPVFESPVYHGYNPSDYYAVARRYGSNETLGRLIREAHRRNMRILLDFVANHTSDQHPAFIAAKSDPNSATAGWYAFGDWPPYGYRSYAHVRNMPELLTERSDVQRYLFDAALYWLGDFGADGLRLDYVPGPSHAFWTLFQQAIKERFPQALTVGEISAPLAEIASYAGRMDAFMDFPLTGKLRRVFAQRTATLADLLAYLDEREAALPTTMERATLLDNHDMHRFLWLAEGRVERLKLAATCHLTLDGTPIIYYGTEVGLSQYSDARKENAYARAPMFWDERQDRELLEHYRRLIALRHQHPALRTGTRTTLPVAIVDTSAADQQQVGAYLRHLDDDELLIVLNNNECSVRLRIACRGEMEAAGEMRQLLPDEQKVRIEHGQIEIELAAMSAAILE